MASTPGKFIISARPSTAGWSRIATRSAADSLAPEVSSSVAGTQELSCTRSVMRSARGSFEEVADAREPQHVRDLMRVADRRGGAVRQDAALELGGRHQAALDVDVGVDEAGRGDPAAGVDLPPAPVGLIGADDPVAADRDVALVQGAGRDVQDASALDHEVSRLPSQRLIDPAAKLGPGRRHTRSPNWWQKPPV